MATDKQDVSGTRTRNLFDPKSKEPFRLSRSKIELFLDCPRCFYIDRRKGVGRVSGPPFNLNIAVDALLKKEFDIHRAKNQAHPLMKAYGVDAVPYTHPELDTWRKNFQGIQYVHPSTNLLITGAVDDVWVDPKGKLIVVDYKATSKAGEIDMSDKWKDAYKRQMEVYQWLLRRNGFKVSDTGYFIFANAGKDREAFDGKLEFVLTVLPHRGDDGWVEDALKAIHECLMAESAPPSTADCKWCAYRRAFEQAMKE